MAGKKKAYYDGFSDREVPVVHYNKSNMRDVPSLPTKDRLNGPPEKIYASRHTLARRASSSPPTQACVVVNPPALVRRSKSGNIMKFKTQKESIRRSYGSLNSLGRSCSSVQSGGSNVSFQKVCVREYPRCVGDNPSVTSGPALTIGWDPLTSRDFSVDDYEKTRIGNKCFKISAKHRSHILQNEWNVPSSHILQASIDSKCVRNQRMETIKQSKREKKIERVMETTLEAMNKLSCHKDLDKKAGDEITKKRKCSFYSYSKPTEGRVFDFESTLRGDGTLF